MSNFWNGKRRYVALLMLLAGFFVMLRVPPVIPVIQLPGEKYPAGWDLPLLGRLTNTFVGSLFVWLLLILLIVYVRRRRPQSGAEVPPGGFYNVFEMAFEGLMNFIGNIAGGKYFATIFKIFMTIFLIVLLSNWMELLPSIDSVGFIEPHVEEVYNAETGHYELETTDGYEIYPSVVGYALNGQCPWVSAEAHETAFVAQVVSANAAADTAREDATRALALEDFEAGHGATEASDETAESDHEATPEAASEGEAEDEDHGEASAEEGALSPDAAAEKAYNDVMASWESGRQARADKGCYSGVTAFVWPSYGEPLGEVHTAEAEHEDEASAEGESADAAHAEGEVPSHPAPNSEEAKLVPWVVLPFWRVPSTDLNMTLSLAIIAVVMIQVMGFRALGIGYLTKFFNFGTLLKSPLGGIDVAVGLLELIGDFAKILSFSFRLIGNIFAGSILIFVMSFLVPFLPWPFFILEFFVGIIQALVFGLLTAIFMNLATISHHHDEEHHETAEAHH